MIPKKDFTLLECNPTTGIYANVCCEGQERAVCVCSTGAVNVWHFARANFQMGRWFRVGG